MRRTRLVYRRRRDALVDSLAEHVPDHPVEGIAAGVHALLRLPDHDDRVVAGRLSQLGLRVLALNDLRYGGQRNSGLVLGYAALPVESADRVARLVREAIGERVTSGSGAPSPP